MILTPLKKLPKNGGDWGKLLPKALKSCPKSNKSTNLVTLSPCNDFNKKNSIKKMRVTASEFRQNYRAFKDFLLRLSFIMSK